MNTGLQILFLFSLYVYISQSDEVGNASFEVNSNELQKCYLLPVTGRCRGAFEKWYFNTKQQKCERFTYGGCDGNANRFDSEQECQRKCMPGIVIANITNTKQYYNDYHGSTRMQSYSTIVMLIGIITFAIFR